MRRIRFSEEQIIGILPEQEAGAKAADLARKHGILGGHIRDELLNESLFLDLNHAREVIGAWVADCNTARPYSSLGYRMPRPMPISSPQPAITLRY